MPDGGVTRHAPRRGAGAADMDVRLAEIAHKAFVRIEVDLLIAEEEDAMRDDGFVHFLHLPIAERPGEIDIADLGPDMRRRGGDGDGVVAHAAAFIDKVR